MKWNFNSILLIVGFLVLNHRDAYGASVVYFQNADYGGQSYILAMEPGVCYNLSFFNDRISSIIAPNCVYAYENAGCNSNDGKHLQI